MEEARLERSEEVPGPQPGLPARPRRRGLRWAFGFLLGAVFLLIALWKVHVGELKKAFLSVDLKFFFPILAAVAAVYWLKAVRWALLLRPLREERPLTARETFPAVMIGFMANNLLPAHLGELIRMYVLATRHGFRKTSVLSTIVLERVFDFLAVVAFLAFGLQFVPARGDLDALRTLSYAIGGACVGVFLFFLAFVWRPAGCLRWAERCLGLFGLRGGLSKKILELLGLAIEGLRSLKSFSTVIAVSFLTGLHWLLNGLGLYLCAVSFSPGVSIVASLLLLGVTALGVTVPSAPGYVGTLQICFVVALSPFAIDRERALAASVYWTFFSYVPVTLAGYYFLGKLGLELRSVKREAERAGGGAGS